MCEVSHSEILDVSLSGVFETRVNHPVLSLKNCARVFLPARDLDSIEASVVVSQRISVDS